MFTRKLEEVGRVLFLISLTQKIPVAHKQSHVSLLQEDLLRLPSFPRSAIDAEFSLFNDPQGIREKAVLLRFQGLGLPQDCLVLPGYNQLPIDDGDAYPNVAPAAIFVVDVVVHAVYILFFLIIGLNR